MPLTIYMDVHVPAAITAGLRRRGVDVLTSQEDGSAEWDDEQLLARSTALGRLLFSQDDDLLKHASAWQKTGTPFGGVIYAHQLSAGIGTLVRDLELVLSCCTAEELNGKVTYLPLQ
jgi:hypothetical protein